MPVPDVWDWQLEALCRDLDSALFFPPSQERGDARHQRDERAKAICLCCPVLGQCGEYALSVREPYGVWGAMTAQEHECV